MHRHQISIRHPAFYATKVQNVLEERLPWPLKTKASRECFAVWRKLERNGMGFRSYPVTAVDVVAWFLDDRLRMPPDSDSSECELRQRRLIKFIEADPVFLGKLLSAAGEVIANPTSAYAMTRPFYELNGHEQLEQLIEKKGAKRITEAEGLAALCAPEITAEEASRRSLKTLGITPKNSLAELDGVRKGMSRIWGKIAKIDRKWNDALAAANNEWDKEKGNLPRDIESFDHRSILQSKGIPASQDALSAAKPKVPPEKTRR